MTDESHLTVALAALVAEHEVKLIKRDDKNPGGGAAKVGIFDAADLEDDSEEAGYSSPPASWRWPAS